MIEATLCRAPPASLRDPLPREPGSRRILREQSFDNLAAALTLLAEALPLFSRARLELLLFCLADADGRVRGNQGDIGRLIDVTRSRVRCALAPVDSRV